MKILICLIPCLCVFAGIHAQNTIQITGGTRLTMNGNVHLVVGAGSFINNGELNGSTGTLLFGGPVSFDGKGSTMVEHFTIAHSSSSVSVLNAPISVTHTATVMFGNFDANNNLMIRSDMNNIANMVVHGAPTGIVNGIVTRATNSIGSCPSYTTTLTLNISGPMLTYQWLSSADSLNWETINGATSEVYSPTITSTAYYRCFVSAINTSFTNMVPGIKLVMDTPRATITGVTKLIKGDTATLTGIASGGNWRSSNPDVVSIDSNGRMTGKIAGTATITYTVTNSWGCSASTSSGITVSDRPRVLITNPAAVCAPAIVDLTLADITIGSDSALSYSYYSDAAATNLLTNPKMIEASGSYYIKGTNSAGIASIPAPVIVTINQPPSGNIIASQGTILCGSSATVTLNITGGNSYTWFKNGIVITGVTGNELTVTGAGDYTANLLSTNGCQAVAGNTIAVTLIESPKAAFTYDSYCINNPILFNNLSIVTESGQFRFLWSDDQGRNSTATSPLFTYTQPGNVSMKLKVTSLICPALADSMIQLIAIEQPVSPIRMQSVNAVINESLGLQARNFGSSYSWAPATGLSNATIANPTTTLIAEQEYRISIKKPSSCITVDTLLVRVYDNRVFVPNVFSPNGDGINDKLFVNLAGVIQLQYFRVFNRYGKIVFETGNATTGWDGRFHNTLLPMDTYVWMVEIIDSLGRVTKKTGNVTLLR